MALGRYRIITVYSNGLALQAEKQDDEVIMRLARVEGEE